MNTHGTEEEMPQTTDKLVSTARPACFSLSRTNTSPNDSPVRGLDRCGETLAKRESRVQTAVRRRVVPKRASTFAVCLYSMMPSRQKWR